MPQFPHNDDAWEEVRDFLTKHSLPYSLILAPESFISIAPAVVSYESLSAFQPASFDHVIIHKGLTPQIGGDNVRYWVTNYQPVFANAVFVMFAKHTPLLFDLESNHYKSLLGQLDESPPLNKNTAAGTDEASLDYWPVVNFLRASCKPEASMLTPTPIRKLFESAIDQQSFDLESLNTLEYVVLSILSVEDFQLRDLKKMLTDCKAIFSDNAFAVYARNNNKGVATGDSGLARTLSRTIDTDSLDASFYLYRQLLLGK